MPQTNDGGATDLTTDAHPPQPSVSVAEVEHAFDEIRELNMSGRDENGHRWANSDLIDQTVTTGLIALRALKGAGRMTAPHDTPRWVYIGGKMVQAKPDAPDHDSSPLYVLARDHAALAERCRVMDEALSDMVGLYDSDEGTRSLPQVVAVRAALTSGGRG